jgi:DNA-binding CsgD family transcriptional regulator/PAS domain-containing protein
MPKRKSSEHSFAELFEQYRTLFNPSLSKENVDYAAIFGESPLLNQVIHHASALLLVLDYTQNKYVYVSPSIKQLYGLPPEKLLNEGPHFLLSGIHPEDLEILVKRVYPAIWKFYREHDAGERKHLYFHFNFRYLNNGSYRHILQQSCYPYHDEAFVPMMNVAYITDITTYKKDNRIYLTINKFDVSKGLEQLTHTFFPAHEEKFFTPTEKNIIRLLAEGKSDLQIADVLFISPHTLVTHRKNMYKKAEVHTLSQLIQFATSMGLV